jgi:hypothetical protein
MAFPWRETTMFTTFFQRLTVVATALLFLVPIPGGAAPIEFRFPGDAPAIATVVNNFRAALGNPDNLNAPGIPPLPGGHREINWDGGGINFGTAAVTPFLGFQNIRGATFTTPGIGLTQTPLTTPLIPPAPVVDIIPGGVVQGSLADINPQYAAIFTTFSPLRLFTPVGSNVGDNVTEATFSIPGSGGTSPATVSGFGAIFADVDLATATSIQYFLTDNTSFTAFAPPNNNGLSFLGVFFNAGEQVSRVRITTGNTPLGLGLSDLNGDLVDVVVMDDFIYGEPQQAIIPEPATLLLLGSGLAGLIIWRRSFS